MTHDTSQQLASHAKEFVWAQAGYWAGWMQTFKYRGMQASSCRVAAERIRMCCASHPSSFTCSVHFALFTKV